MRESSSDFEEQYIELTYGEILQRFIFRRQGVIYPLYKVVLENSYVMNGAGHSDLRRVQLPRL